MKTTLTSAWVRNGTAPIPLLLVFTAAATLLCSNGHAQTVDLGTAGNFGVLSATGITNTGATTINGDVGAFPTSSITGFGTVTLNGTNQGGNTISQVAQNDLTTAYNTAAGLVPTTTYSPVMDLGGLTLTAGVYNDPSSLAITGTLVLNGQGNSNAVFVFQAGSTLTTASNATIILENGAQASNVFWQVGSSATLGTSTDFSGNILANTSVTLTTGATVLGSVLAENGAVTLDSNTITAAAVPEPDSAVLFCLGALVLLRRKRPAQA